MVSESPPPLAVITRFMRVIQLKCPQMDCPDKPGNDG